MVNCLQDEILLLVGSFAIPLKSYHTKREFVILISNQKDEGTYLFLQLTCV